MNPNSFGSTETFGSGEPAVAVFMKFNVLERAKGDALPDETRKATAPYEDRLARVVNVRPCGSEHADDGDHCEDTCNDKPNMD